MNRFSFRVPNRSRAAIAGIVVAIATMGVPQLARGQADSGGGTLTVRSDVQEANSETGVITARGNVRIDYPAQDLQATAAQAQYFRNERRLVLSGNVYVLQEGNSIRAETITYLLDEGRFIATERGEQQVESTYIITDSASEPGTTSAPSLPSLDSPTGGDR